MLTDDQILQFQETIWEYFRTHRRNMPWRDDPAPYHVLVSELMLQQTQVNRVLPKYEAFLHRFPTLHDLAAAPLGDVLSEWSGLGYNRRAKFLHMAAQKVMVDFGGQLPETRELLVSLPGIGVNTAGALLAYAFNKPVVFIETNIRTVYFHHFFADVQGVDDRELVPFIEQTVDREHPREWYWALMDYGTYLKHTSGNNISQSRHYTRQSKFEGSKRQIRGAVLRLLTAGPQPRQEVTHRIADTRTPAILDELLHEGLIEQFEGLLRLTGSTQSGHN